MQLKGIARDAHEGDAQQAPLDAPNPSALQLTSQPSRVADVPLCEAVSVFPKVRLAFASCTLVLILAYVAWHDQQRARTVSVPTPPTGFELASGPRMAAAPQPRAHSALEPLSATEPELAPRPQVAAGSQSVLDPRPWSAGPAVPELQPAPVQTEPPPSVQTEEGTAAEARSTSEPRGGTVAPVVQSSATMRETAIASRSPDITPIPLPRPRPRKPPAVGARNAASTPLRLN